MWSAGVKAPDFLKDIDGLETNRINQLVVEPTLQTTRDPDIFAIGDCASCPRPGEATPVPPRAQAAHQMADHMVAQIKRRLAGEPLDPLSLPGLRLAGVAWQIQHGRQPDGLRGWARHVHRGALRPPHLSLAVQDARGRPARRSNGDLADPGGRAFAGADAERQAALVPPGRFLPRPFLPMQRMVTDRRSHCVGIDVCPGYASAAD